MDDHKPWRPHMKRLPVFNPFEPSTTWNAEMGANDRIEIEDEEATERSVPVNPGTEKIDEK